MNPTLSVVSLLLCISTSLQAGILADLYKDLHAAIKSAKVGDTFTHNGWSISQGGKPLVYDKALYDSSTAGYKADDPAFELDRKLDLGNISAGGVYDNQVAEAKELGFHPSFKAGKPNDVVLQWSADKDHKLLVLRFKYRRASEGGTVGLAVQLNEQPFTYDNKMIGTEVISKTLIFRNVRAGDTLKMLFYNGEDKTGDADQAFGNFTIIGH